MKMTLHDLEFLRLLPQFMREDAAVQGLAAAMDEIIPQLAGSVRLLTTWDQIDHLSEAELDDLAWELNVLWYDKQANIDIKRDVIKNSDKVYQHLGTKWAAENVIASYFGEGRIEEWWEYNGDPGHFRVITSNPSVNSEKLAEFKALLQNVKRASAKLDGIIIAIDGLMNLYAGVALHEVGREQFSIGAKPLE